MSHHDTEWLPTSLLEAYHYLSPIGADEVTAAFRGHEVATERDIILKVLLPELCASPRAVTRFKEAASVAARLVHANIIKIHTVDEAAGVPYLVVTPPVPAESLRVKLSREGPLPRHITRAIAAQVGAALAHAHQHGVIHRGLTPNRIFVTRAGRVYVTDFGIAAARHTFSLAQMGMVMGTPEYLPPEGITGTFAPQSDLYTLALIIYEMCTGTVPFQDRDPLTTLHRQAYEHPRPPTERGINVGVAFERALLKALNKQPDERYADVDTMLHALGALGDGSRTDSVVAAVSRRHVGDPPTPTVPPPASETDPPLRDTMQHERDVPARPGRPITPPHVRVVPAIALAVIIITSILIASQRPFTGRPVQPSGRAFAGVVTQTTGPPSTTTPTLTILTATSQPARPVVGSASTPTRAIMPSATVTEEILATATGISTPPPTELPPTFTATAGATELADVSVPVRTIAPINVRSGPGLNFPVIMGLDTGQPVTVFGQNSAGDWLSVIVSAGTEGWVAREFTTFDGVAPIQPAPPLPATPSPIIVTLPPSPTPVPPASPTPTTVVATQYDVPLLQLPIDGASHAAPITFQWTWNGTLADNEYFDVRLWQEDDPHLGIAWTKSSQLLVEDILPSGVYFWSVAVVRGENGQWVANLSPEAPPRTVSVLAPTDNGGDAGSPPSQQPTQPPQPQPSPTR